MIKIIHTEESPHTFAGQEKRVLSELIGLRERGYRVALACKEKSPLKEEAEKCSIKVYTLSFNNLFDIKSILQLIRILRKEKFDIINTHSSVDSWIGGIAAKLARTPVLIRTRHSDRPIRRDVRHFIHYLPDIYVTCGETMRKKLIEKYGFPEGKTISIPSGISEDFFHIKREPDVKSRYGLDRDTKVITSIGRLCREKGHETTISAIKSVIKYFPNTKFLFVGDGGRRKKLEEKISSLGVDQYVLFTGFIRDVKEIFSFSDVMVLSSWSEGLPQSLLQAMASGVPVVATKVGGVPEIVIDGKTGILVNPGDSQGLSEGIIKILKNSDITSEFVKNARELVKNKYTITHMLDKTEELHQQLLRQKGKAETCFSLL